MSDIRPSGDPPSESCRSLAQSLMEWGPLVRIYESRLWRRSPVFAAFTGISFDDEYSLIADAARISRTSQILDLACGPGIYARRFARRARQGAVVGLDLSMPMLRYATRRAKEEAFRNLHLVRGDALSLPFEDGLFDAVNCCGALHLFPDVTCVLREIHRVLKDGGRVTIAAFRRGEGPLARLQNEVRRRVIGVDAFSLPDLTARLKGAGFSRPRCLHAAGIWLLVTARKA